MSQYFSNCPQLRISIDLDKSETVCLSLDGIQIPMSPYPNCKVTVLFEKPDSDAKLGAAFNELRCCKQAFMLFTGNYNKRKNIKAYFNPSLLLFSN